MADFEAPRREALPGKKYDFFQYLKFQRITVHSARLVAISVKID